MDADAAVADDADINDDDDRNLFVPLEDAATPVGKSGVLDKIGACMHRKQEAEQAEHT